MYESRCGVRCELCEKKSAGTCAGCLAIKTPYWGCVCSTKKCCEDRGLDHCGRCPEFPCTMLSEMGKEYGFDPSIKIEQCRKWAQEKA